MNKNMMFLLGGVIFVVIVTIAFVMLQGKDEVAQTPAAVVGSTVSFMEKFSQTENAVLVDVRTPEEYVEGHIEGAINIDFHSPTFVDEMKEVGTGKSFFIYCRSGNRSGQAVALLKREGLAVEDLKGGIGAHPELLN